MATVAPFTVAIPQDTPDADRDALLLALRSTADVELATTRTGLSPHETLEAFRVVLHSAVAVAPDASKLLDVGAKLTTFITAIATLRAQLNQQGHSLPGRIERTGKPPLDLATATDQHLLAYLLDSQPDH